MRKKEVKRLLGISNRTVKEQMDKIISLNDDIERLEELALKLTAIDDKQIAIAEKSISRQQIIIHYLESRLLEIQLDE